LATPAYGQQVMLRTEFPQASRVVTPTLARSCIASSTSCSFTKWNWMFWRAECAPLVGADLPALKLLQRGDELVDVVLVGERETRATKGLCIVDG